MSTLLHDSSILTHYYMHSSSSFFNTDALELHTAVAAACRQIYGCCNLSVCCMTAVTSRTDAPVSTQQHGWELLQSFTFLWLVRASLSCKPAVSSHRNLLIQDHSHWLLQAFGFYMLLQQVESYMAGRWYRHAYYYKAAASCCCFARLLQSFARVYGCRSCAHW